MKSKHSNSPCSVYAYGAVAYHMLRKLLELHCRRNYNRRKEGKKRIKSSSKNIILALKKNQYFTRLLIYMGYMLFINKHFFGFGLFITFFYNIHHKLAFSIIYYGCKVIDGVDIQ